MILYLIYNIKLIISYAISGSLRCSWDYKKSHCCVSFILNITHIIAIVLDDLVHRIH